MSEGKIGMGLVLAYGQNPDGSLLPQTAARCRKMFELYQTGWVKKIFITNATFHQPSGTVMGAKMAEFLHELGVPVKAIFYLPCGKNTAGEIKKFLDLNNRTRVLWAVTSWYHVPRVLWLFYILPNQYGRFRFVNVRWVRDCSWQDLKIEPFKLLKDILSLGRSAKVVEPCERCGDVHY